MAVGSRHKTTKATKAAHSKQGATWWVRDKDLLRESGYLINGYGEERERGKGRWEKSRERKRNRKIERMG